MDFFSHVLLAGYLQALRQRFQEEYREVVERRVYTGEIVGLLLWINSDYSSLMSSLQLSSVREADVPKGPAQLWKH
jgi:hypothetical protein